MAGAELRAALEQRLDALGIRREVVEHPEVRRSRRARQAGTRRRGSGGGRRCWVRRAGQQNHSSRVMCRRNVSRTFSGLQYGRHLTKTSKTSLFGITMLLGENLCTLNWCGLLISVHFTGS